MRAALALVLALTALAAAAGVVGVLATFHQDHRLAVATVRMSVHPGQAGSLALYVPLMDWDVRFPVVRLPAQLRLDVRSVDVGPIVCATVYFVHLGVSAWRTSTCGWPPCQGMATIVSSGGSPSGPSVASTVLPSCERPKATVFCLRLVRSRARPLRTATAHALLLAASLALVDEAQCELAGCG